MIVYFHRRLFSSGLLRQIFAAAGLTTTLLAPMQLVAQERYEARDIPMLPAYCKHTQDFRERVPGGNNPADIERWTTVMGPTFIHMHHYCYGLVDINRAMFFSPTQQERTHYLSNSILEFNYVIRNAPPNFVLLPEIFTKKGESLLRMGKGQLGALELQRAIGLKPDYWPPYAAMSDFFRKSGDLAKAREWLKKGLSLAPDSKALKNRLAELDAANGKRKTTPLPESKTD